MRSRPPSASAALTIRARPALLLDWAVLVTTAAVTARPMRRIARNCVDTARIVQSGIREGPPEGGHNRDRFKSTVSKSSWYRWVATVVLAAAAAACGSTTPAEKSAVPAWERENPIKPP